MEYALEMPAGQFFAMLEACRVLRNKERVLDCYVARSSQMSADGFKETIDYFAGLETPKEVPEEFKDEGVPPRMALRGNEARDAVKFALAGTKLINYPDIKMVH